MAVAALGALGAIGSIAGTVVGFIGSLQSSKAAKKAERAKQRQARLEAKRARRESIRRASVQRARALAIGVNQGASPGDTGVVGAQQTITGIGRREQAGIQQSARLTDAVFDARRDQLKGDTLSSIGAGISNFFGSFA